MRRAFVPQTHVRSAQSVRNAHSAHNARSAVVVGLCGSLLLHGGLAAYMLLATRLPTWELSLADPAQVEFGIAEFGGQEPQADGQTGEHNPEPTEAPAETTATTLAPPDTADTTAASDAAPVGSTEPPPATSPQVTEAPAPRRRARVRRRSQPPAAPPTDAERVLSSILGGSTPPHAGANLEGPVTPAAHGRHLAIRLNLRALRGSALETDIRALLGALPDWHILLRGSDIDPIRDLDQLLIASASLKREGLVIAGRHNGGYETLRHAAERMSTTHGEQPHWRTVLGVPSVGWPTDDPTPRLLAMIGREHFVISRTQDMPAVLSIARHRSSQSATDADSSQPFADGLLALREGSVLELDVENAPEFIHGPPSVIPQRAQLHVRRQTAGADGKMLVIATGEFESTPQAEAAQRYWEARKNRYGSHPFVALAGLSEFLLGSTLRQDAHTLRFESTLTEAQTQSVLRFAVSAAQSR
jgi:hypothetical protein